MIIHNPVLPGFYADPSVCRAGGRFYLACSTFELYPGIPIFESEDLVNWTLLGHCLLTPTQARLDGLAASRGIWAPTLRYHEGLFYLCVTNMDRGGNFIITAENPAGPWSEPVYVPMKSIDPCLFFEDGKAWFLTPQTKTAGAVRGVYMAQVDVKTGALLSDEHLLWQGSGGKCLEGPRLYHIGDYYYLLCAEGGTEYGHMVTVARSESLLGPYESCPHNPILTNRDDHDNPLQCAGHGDLVQAPTGDWYMTVHASRWGSKWFSHLGRETCVVPMEFADGWPRQTGGEKRLLTQVDIPLAHTQRTDWGFAFAFDREEFDPGFVWVRNPYRENYRIDTKARSLYLTGGEPLDTLGSPTLLCHRQRSMDCQTQVTVDFAPDGRSEAGLCVYLSGENHYTIGIGGTKERPVLRVHRRMGLLRALVAEQALPASPITLLIDATPTLYSLGYRDEAGTEHLLAQGETKYLSNEVGKLFTGVLLGLYCVSPTGQTARFSQFHCIDRRP